MKKIFAVLLLLALVGCGSGNAQSSVSPSPSPDPTDTPDSPVTYNNTGPYTINDTGFHCEGTVGGMTADRDNLYVVCDTTGHMFVIRIPKENIK